MTTMTRLEDWAYADNVRDLLANELVQGHLTLILGAGVSRAIGLPQWDQLLDGLELDFGVARTSGSTPWQRADAVRSRLGTDARLKEETHARLYKDVNLVKDTAQPLLVALGAMLTSASRTGPTTTITLNYDDVLEQYLEIHGNVVEVDHDARQKVAGGNMVLWHPHGYLPQNDLTRASETIVLDTSSFARIMAHEQWQQLLVSQLRRSFCLFIGLSGDDLHLEQHLATCAEQNSFLETLPRWGIWLTHAKDFEERRKRLGSRGVHALPFSDYEKYPEFVLGICQRVAEIRGNRPPASSAVLQRRTQV